MLGSFWFENKFSYLIVSSWINYELNSDLTTIISVVGQKLLSLMMLVSINVVGVLTHFPADMAKRKAFSEIRQYVRAKITIQKETVRQVFITI